MPIPDSAAQNQLISSARTHAAELVRAFADETSPRESVNATCARATATLDRYCASLLDKMISALPPVTTSDVTWLRSQYLTLIVEFGSAIRDAIQDSETRHAAAQGIQFSVLEHERHLRPALAAAVLANTPVAAIVPPKPEAAPLANTPVVAIVPPKPDAAPLPAPAPSETV